MTTKPAIIPWPSWLPIRDDLRGITPYGAPQVPADARMNTNENPYPPSDHLISAIAQRVKEVSGSLNRYPDRDAITLRTGLAQYLNDGSSTSLTHENIWAANGSNEIIQTLLLTFGDGLALGFVPTYSMHSLIAKVTRTKWVDGTRREDFSLDARIACEEINYRKPSLVFITTPNNPTGSSISLEEIEKLAVASMEEGGLLLVDEAYEEFSMRKSAVTLLDRFPNVVVIRTMSKAFAFAGARVGYMAAHPDVIKAVQLVRLPYHLSVVTQAIASVALDFTGELLAGVKKIVSARNEMERELEDLGCRVIPSDANFLLFSVPSSEKMWKSILDRGVLIRDVGLSGYLRVTIGTDEENRRFIAELKSALGGQK